MAISNEIPANYFKRYRATLGFSAQDAAKRFLSAKDIVSNIDDAYLHELNLRVKELAALLLSHIPVLKKHGFCIENLNSTVIDTALDIVVSEGLLPRLNNQGRRPEEVWFSWLRGYIVCHLFTPVFADIFNIPAEKIVTIGQDDLRKVETFKRAADADLEFTHTTGKLIRLEIQAGFQGINDIKEHKIREAKVQAEKSKVVTICIHVDLYNGQMGFVRLDNIPNDHHNFVTRQQMEGQSVLVIDQNYFKWRLLDESLPELSALELGL